MGKWANRLLERIYRIVPESLLLSSAAVGAIISTKQRSKLRGDHYGPFSTERYFDGQRVRTVDSGYELEQAYLAPLGLRREQCWITDMVRGFLFKVEF